MPLPKNNLRYPVQITLGAGKSSGSGFYLNSKSAAYLVSATHVFYRNGLQLYDEGAKLTSLAEDMKAKVIIELDCRKLEDAGVLRRHPTADVLVCKLGQIAIEDEKRVLKFEDGVINPELSAGNPTGEIVGLSIKNVTKFEDVGISNASFLFGYPSSLGLQAQLDRSTPLLRHGIVAGKTENGRIVIDCPVYFGTSGGLVIETVEKSAFGKDYRGIGIAVEMIPFVEELWSKQFRIQTGSRYENSGYALIEPMDRVLELIDPEPADEN
jgi:hypothetical protein